MDRTSEAGHLRGAHEPRHAKVADLHLLLRAHKDVACATQQESEQANSSALTCPKHGREVRPTQADAKTLNPTPKTRPLS
jgi:hypothetical protein